MSKIADFFKFRRRNTSYKKELTVGITTFMIMVHVLAVQSGTIVDYGDTAFIIDANGAMITREAIVVTCAIINGLITLLVILYANLPFILAAGMGSNFIFGVLIQSQQLSLGSVTAMILISDAILLLLTIFGIRDLIVKAIPKNTKISTGTAVGFFIAYLRFKNTGIAAFTESGVGMGNFTDPAAMLAVLGSIIVTTLTAYRMSDAILIGIAIVMLLGILAGVTTVPSTFAKVPDFTRLGNAVFNLDLKSIFSFLSVVLIFTALCGDFFSALGTTLGASVKADMLDENGDLSNTQQPFLVGAIGTYVGASTGNTAITTFVESNASVEAGGRMGFTNVVVSVIFMIMVLPSPLVLMIPNVAAGPVLILVGLLMTSGFKNTDFTDFTESSGPLVMIMLTVFTDSIASGISTGTLVFVLIKTVTGKFREVHSITYVIAIPLICYFIYG